MATLDDKLLGEKLDYYCSESESEEGESGEDELTSVQDRNSSCEIRNWEGTSTNTGPKGVIQDFQRYKQLEREHREENERELVQLAKRFSITCRTNAEEEKAKAEEQKLEDELSELLSDSFIQQFVQQRMQEMLAKEASQPTFTQVYHLEDGNQFLDAVDKEDKNVCVIVLLYEPNATGCSAALRAIDIMSKEYRHIKFCTVRPSFISMSANFKLGAVPALLAYKAGQLMGNFIKLTNDLGDDFDSSDLESYLIEHGIFQDRNLVPDLGRITNKAPLDSSDDEN